jgi:hypothetical protein
LNICVTNLMKILASVEYKPQTMEPEKLGVSGPSTLSQQPIR